MDKRERLGDWEADLIIGKNNRGAALTLADRVSRFTLISPVKSKHASVIRTAMTAILTHQRVETITFDNGREFADHYKTGKDLNADTYFCDPYASWQRGLNENTNGLIRQYRPKNHELTDLTQSECDQITHDLNNRPRKCLDWATPNETVALHN